MKSSVGWVLCGVDVWISPRLLNSKVNELRNAVISKKRGHDKAFNSLDIILKGIEV
jgi:hypothetical protein